MKNGERTNENLFSERAFDLEKVNPVACMSQKKRYLMIEEDGNKVSFYFDPLDYRLDEEENEKEVSKELRSMVNSRFCSSFDLARFKRGEIVVYFNPLKQNDYSKNATMGAVIETIRLMPPERR